jgi:hypothetical protein
MSDSTAVRLRRGLCDSSLAKVAPAKIELPSQTRSFEIMRASCGANLTAFAGGVRPKVRNEKNDKRDYRQRAEHKVNHNKQFESWHARSMICRYLRRCEAVVSRIVMPVEETADEVPVATSFRQVPSFRRD